MCGGYMNRVDLKWPAFEVVNPDKERSFEDLCRRLFSAHFLKDQCLIHTDPNLPGIEVLPVLEPERKDGKARKRISFQAKYVQNITKAYSEFKKSAKQTAKNYKDQLECVYIFCNKALTSTSKQYRTITQIHSEAGIETILITDSELLDLISKYETIAEYYFCNRKTVDLSGLSGQYPKGFIIDELTGNVTITPEVFGKGEYNNELTTKLVDEKLVKFREYALNLEIDALRTEVESILSVGIEHIKKSGEIYFYTCLVYLHDGKEVEEIISKCNNEYRKEVDWLRNYCNNPYRISVEEFKLHMDIIEVFIIDKMFTSLNWQNILDLYIHLNIKKDNIIYKQFTLHYGLALLNLQKNDQASKTLYELYRETKESRIDFYATLAAIRFENSVYTDAQAGNQIRLKELLNHLETYRDLRQYKRQLLAVTTVKYLAYYNIGTEDKDYLTHAINEYNTYEEDIKNNETIKFYYALCLEYDGQSNKAEQVYSALEWKANSSIAIRYMITLKNNHKPQEVLQVYKQLDQEAQTIDTEAMYLSALRDIDPQLHITELKNACTKYEDDLSALVQIAYCEEDPDVLVKHIIPLLKKKIEKDEKSKMERSFQQSIKLLLILAHTKEVILLYQELCKISDIKKINQLTVKIIYSCLAEVCNDRTIFKNGSFDTNKKAQIVEKIADMFLKEKMCPEDFLRIKLFCAEEKESPYSILQYSKELYKYRESVSLARNIITALIDRNETRSSEYEPYLSKLQQSIEPEHCLVVAYAYMHMGQEEKADSYAYKALYLLNDKDDYNIYRLFFGYANQDMRCFSDEKYYDKNEVITLVEKENVSEKRTICLDSEVDFTYDNNMCMGLEHINPKNIEYIKMHNAVIGKTVTLDNKIYLVKEIQNRFQYCVDFVLSKIYSNPDKFPVQLIKFNENNPEETIQHIRKLADRTKQTEHLLEAYHFVNNPGGLPIECVGYNNYDNYIHTFRFLLHGKDQALYTGDIIFETIDNKVYVPTLSTLVLLAEMDMMYCLDGIKDKCIIPDSYMAFFKERYEKALMDQKHDIKNMYFVQNKAVIEDADISVADIWEKILTFCNACKQEAITDEERMGIQFGDKLSGEKLIVSLKLNQIQLDSLILAQKESAAYICDDCFFRKAANWIGVKNYNTASILLHYTDEQFKCTNVIKLSRTNYIYVPLIALNNIEKEELYKNMMSGEKKRTIYGGYIQMLNNIAEELYKRLTQDNEGK